MLKKKVNTENN